jgi:hypothetical protein
MISQKPPLPHYKAEELETGAMDLVSVSGDLLNQYKCPLGCDGGFVEGDLMIFSLKTSLISLLTLTVQILVMEMWFAKNVDASYQSVSLILEENGETSATVLMIRAVSVSRTNS